MGEQIDRKDLAEHVKRLRAGGKTVVFTNGAFDLLHVGHLRYLMGAAALGDVLVCAVNSDASVRELKGEGRPILPHDERMEIIAGLECVDVVTGFDEPNVASLLLELKPEIHAKGTDYTEDTVPEVQTVRSYGGKVAITGDSKNHNTTETIVAIRNRKEAGT